MSKTSPYNDGTSNGLSNLRTRPTRRVAHVALALGGLLSVLAIAPAGFAQEASTTVPTGEASTTVAPTTGPASTVAPSTPPVSTVPVTSLPVTTVPVSTVVPSSTIVPPATTAPPTTQPAPLIVVPKGKTLKVGSKGDAVLALEERLEELKIDTGKVDGRFDWSTWQGVVAFQKYHGLKRSGTVNAETAKRIEFSLPVGGIKRAAGGNWLEVDKGRQITFLYRDGELYRMFAVSTGSGRKYCETGRSGAKVCGSATTPPGNFRIQRRISGWRESELGRLYNPLYFNGGIAFHGAPSVPAYPASHGCVRLPMPIAEWFPDFVNNGWPVYVYE